MRRELPNLVRIITVCGWRIQDSNVSKWGNYLDPIPFFGLLSISLSSQAIVFHFLHSSHSYYFHPVGSPVNYAATTLVCSLIVRYFWALFGAVGNPWIRDCLEPTVLIRVHKQEESNSSVLNVLCSIEKRAHVDVNKQRINDVTVKNRTTIWSNISASG